MIVRPILIWLDPRPSENCAPAVSTAKTADLVRDLFASMYAAAGQGLAAPQIGVLQWIFFWMPVGKMVQRRRTFALNWRFW